MANQWFRLYAEFAHDPKVQVLTEALQRRYVMVLCMQCSEHLEKRPDDEIALSLRITLEDWRVTKDEFIKRGLLLPNGKLNGWEKRQFISDIKDPTAAERQKRYRDNKRNQRNESVTSHPPEQNRTEQIHIKAIIPSDAGRLPCPHEKIIETYHRILPTMPSVRVWTEQRKKKLASRWREDESRQSLDYWERFFNYISKSDFLCGRTEKPFSCDLEWIVNSANFVKIIEGKYHAS